jgi:hypothetical protein
LHLGHDLAGGSPSGEGIADLAPGVEQLAIGRGLNLKLDLLPAIGSVELFELLLKPLDLLLKLCRISGKADADTAYLLFSHEGYL